MTEIGILTRLPHGTHRVWKNRLKENDPYVNWKNEHFILPGEALIAARGFDADGDGESNIFEFLTRTNPRSSADAMHLAPHSYTFIDGGRISVRHDFQMRDEVSTPYVLVEESADPSNWLWFNWNGSIRDSNAGDGLLDVIASLRLSPERPHGRLRIGYDP